MEGPGGSSFQSRCLNGSAVAMNAFADDPMWEWSPQIMNE